MPIADSPRGASPPGPPPRPARSKRWIWVTLLTLVGIAIPTTVVFFRAGPDRTRVWEVTADLFVHGISVGSGPVEGGRTGYEVAYDLLSEQRRENLAFDVFFEDWSRLFDQRGFIVAQKRVGDHDAKGRTRDPISYVLFLGGEHQDHSRLSTLKLDITLQRRGNRYSVATYAISDVPNPLATR